MLWLYVSCLVFETSTFSDGCWTDGGTEIKRGGIYLHLTRILDLP